MPSDQMTVSAAERLRKMEQMLRKRQKQLETDRQVVDDVVEQITQYVLPIRENVYGTDPKGTRYGKKAHDSTAILAKNTFVDGMHGQLMSPNFRWFALEHDDTELNQLQEVRQYMQDVEHVVYAELAESNFYSEGRTCIEDACCIGTSFLYPEEDLGRRRLVFNAWHPSSVWIAENQYRVVDVLHRKERMSHRQIVEKFGEENVGGELLRDAEDQPFKTKDLLHCIFPRTDRDVMKVDALNKPYASVWMLAGEKQKVQGRDTAILKESGLDTFVPISWRFLIAGYGEVYGRGIPYDMLAEIRGLNIISKDLLGASSLAVRPPLNIPADMAGSTDFTPWGHNYYKDQNMRVEPIQMVGNYPLGLDREERKRAVIEEFFMVDLFRMLARLPERDKITATEIIERRTEKENLLGPMVGRMTSEFLDSVLQKTLDALNDAGKLPPPPPILEDMGRVSLKVEYVSPLALAQRRSLENAGVARATADIAPLVELYGPEKTLDNFDPDILVRKVARDSGMPAEAFVPEEVRDARREAQKEQERQALFKQDLAETAQGLKALGQADKATGGKILSEEEAA